MGIWIDYRRKYDWVIVCGLCHRILGIDSRKADIDIPLEYTKYDEWDNKKRHGLRNVIDAHETMHTDLRNESVSFFLCEKTSTSNPILKIKVRN